MPTDETFPAPAPSDLSTIIHLPTSGTISYSTTPTSAKTSTSASKSTDSGSPSSPSMSPGTAAGIGVGVGIGVIAIAATGFFLLRRRRSRSMPTKQVPNTDDGIAQQLSQSFGHRLNNSPGIHEVEARHVYVELEGHNKQ